MEQATVKVSFHIPIEAIGKHLTGAQRGLIVTWASELPNFHSVEVFKTAITITVALGQGAKFTSENEVVEAIKTLCDLDPLPCPCGCGAFLVLHNCFRQSGEMGVGKLTKEEHDQCGAGNPIGCIKLIRARLGIGLKDAKDLHDAHRAEFFPALDREYWSRQHSVYAPASVSPGVAPASPRQTAQQKLDAMKKALLGQD